MGKLLNIYQTIPLSFEKKPSIFTVKVNPIVRQYRIALIINLDMLKQSYRFQTMIPMIVR